MWLLSLFLLPFIHILVLRRVKKGLEDPKRYKERFGITNLKPSGPVVWFHGASIGESVALLPLLFEWQKRYPDDQLLVTTVTRTSAEIMKKRMPMGCIHQYVPFDILFWVNRFIKTWKPKALIIAESEIWPNMIVQVKKYGCTVYNINGKLSDKSYAFWKKVPSLAKKVLGNLDFAFVQSEQDLRRYKELGAQNVEILPNLKYAAEPLPFAPSDLSAFKNAWIAVSTHAGEEEIVINWHKALSQSLPNTSTIIIPRHPVRAEEIAGLIRAQGYSVHLRSESLRAESLGSKKQGPDFYIVDTLGEVGLFFSLQCPVLLGGTLVNIGGHNPIEPAQMGCSVIIGPYSHKVDQIVQDLGLLKGDTLESTFFLLKKSLSTPKSENCIQEKLARYRAKIVNRFFEAESGR